ncbi:MAG: hypothetical protein P4L67_00905 [Candidatus Pacebacteria bacterium]|nr:hypothetical protein [Candidatus Paceibacterota bacterium]
MYRRRHAHRFEHLPYSPETTDSWASTYLRTAPSNRVPGTTGVFNSTRLQPDMKLSWYAGYLFSNGMYEELNAMGKITTAVDLPVLNFEVEPNSEQAKALLVPADESLVEMVLVGDPRQFGSLFNSPRDLGIEANCTMASCKPSLLKSHITRKKDRLGKPIVHSAILCISSGSTAIPAGQELFIPYERGEARRSNVRPDKNVYWDPQAAMDQESPPCHQCRLRKGEPSNPLVRCAYASPTERDHLDAPLRCTIAFHANCFSKTAYPAWKAMYWYCEEHMKGRPRAVILSNSSCFLTASPPPPPQSQPQPLPARRPFGMTEGVRQAFLNASPVTPIVRRAPAPATSIAQPLKHRFDSSARSCQAPPFRSETSTSWRTNDFPDSKSEPAPLESEYEASSSSEAEVSEEEDLDRDDTTVVVSESKRASNYGSRRSRGFKPLSIPSEPPPATALLSEEGRKKVNDVQVEFDHDPFTDPKDFDHLQRRFEAVQAHCCTREKMSQLASSLAHCHSIFNGADTFLRSRYQYWKKMGGREAVRLHVGQHFASHHKTWDWMGMELCEACYSYLLGVGRSTMFDWTTEEAMVANGSKSAIDECEEPMGEFEGIMYRYLLGLVENHEAQTRPGADGTTADGRSIRVLNYLTWTLAWKDAVDRLRKSMFGLGPFDTDKSNPWTISRNTFQRAVEAVHRTRPWKLEVKKWKGLAKCDDCEKLQNAIKQAPPNGKVAARGAFNNHNKEWMEQRQFFERKKTEAVTTPWNWWTFTMDGMDQAKTAIPSYTDKLHDSATQENLPTRVVGFFGFGAVHPNGAVTTLPNVQSKGGAASITAAELVFNAQFEAMDTEIWYPIPDAPFIGDDPRAIAANSSKSFDSSLDSNRSNPLLEPSPTNSSNPPEIELDPFKEQDPAAGPKVQSSVWSGMSPNSKVPFMWPLSIHFTYDNAGSDFHNGHFLSWCGQLVAIGVFKEITISTLLVGHTHDIVDQMFSVWAFRLKHQNAPSLSRLHELFQENYGSRVYASDDLVVEAPATRRHSTKSAAVRRSSSASTSRSTQSKSGGRAKVRRNVASYLLHVAEKRGVKPVMIQQKYCIETEGWCFTEGQISNIKSVHQFYICEEEIKGEQTIMLYSRQLAPFDPETGGRKQPEYLYPDVRHGPWSQRMELFQSKNRQTDDPFIKPPLRVDTKPVREHLKMRHATAATVKEGDKWLANMTDAEFEEMTGYLDEFDSEQLRLSAQCSICTTYVEKLKEIGTIHGGENAAERKESAEKKREKDKTRDALREHIKAAKHEFFKLNDKFEEVEQGDGMPPVKKLVQEGWWSKWIRRVKDVIEPYRKSRGVVSVLTPEERVAGYSKRVKLPGDAATKKPSKPTWKCPTCKCQNPLLAPQCCHAKKGTEGEESFGGVMCGTVRPENALALAKAAAEAKAAAGAKAASSPSPLAAAAASNPAASNPSPDSEPAPRLSTSEQCRALNGAPRAGQYAVVRSQDPFVPYWIGKIKMTRGFDPSDDTASVFSSSTRTPIHSNDSPPAVAASRPRRAAARQSRPLLEGHPDSEEEFESKRPNKRPKHVSKSKSKSTKRKATTTSSKRAKKRTKRDSDYDEEEEEEEEEESESNEASESEDEESSEKSAWEVQVAWWEYKRTAAAINLQLGGGKKSDQAVVTAIDSDENAPLNTIAAWELAKKNFKAGKFGQLPVQVITRLRPLSYAPCNPPQDSDWLDYDQLIVWGSDVLTESNVIRESYFKWILEDLTTEDSNAKLADAAAAAAAAASSSSSMPVAAPAASEAAMDLSQ